VKFGTEWTQILPSCGAKNLKIAVSVILKYWRNAAGNNFKELLHTGKVKDVALNFMLFVHN